MEPIGTAIYVDPYRRNLSPDMNCAGGELKFDDFLDAINPLQHIPIVNLVYREITGDKIGAAAAIAGGALFGGATGFAGAILTAAFESVTGDTPAGHLASLLDRPSPQTAAQAYARYQALADG